MQKVLRVLLLAILILGATNVSGTTTILNTQTSLIGNETFTTILFVQEGNLSITVSTSQGQLNFTIYQTNKTLMTTSLTRTTGNYTESISAESGEVTIFARSSGNFIPSDVSILVTQELDQSIANLGLLIGGGVVIVLLLPFAYLLGRSQGKSS